MQPKRFRLIISAIVRFGLGFASIGLMLFFCAGTVQYLNGWLFIGVLVVPMLVFGSVLLIRDPAALERRLNSREPDKAQVAVIVASAVMFISMFVVAGLDFRLGWSQMVLPISIAAAAVLLAGYLLFAVVIMQNSYAARVVDVFEDQKVITTGLYSIVRHPMYLATLMIFLPMPIILGSWFAVIPMLIYPAILVPRIKNEEALLIRELDGYSEYLQQVRYRLLPFIW